jgi:hypothetical protein
LNVVVPQLVYQDSDWVERVVVVGVVSGHFLRRLFAIAPEMH